MSFFFKYKKDDLIIGINFDVPEEIDTKFRVRQDFAYGLIKVGDKYIVPFGLYKNGNFGVMLPVVAPSRVGVSSYNDIDISALVEDYIYGKYTLDETKDLLTNRPIVNPKDQSFHALLLDRYGDSLIIEPDRGAKDIDEDITVLTGFSYFEPFSTKNAYNSGYDTYRTIMTALEMHKGDLKVSEAFNLLQSLKSDGENPVRISAVYTQKENCIYYVLDGDFANIHECRFK